MAGFMEIVIALISFVAFYIILFIPLRNLFKLRKFPFFNGPETYPILGNFFDILKIQSDFKSAVDIWKSFNSPIGVLWITYWYPLVVVSKSKDIKRILSSREHVSKGMVYKALDRIIGTGAFNSPVHIWKQRRPYFEHAFRPAILQQLPKVFDLCSRELIKAIQEDGKDGGEEFDFHKYANLCSIHMLVEGALGLKVDTFTDRKNKNGFWNKAIKVYDKGTDIVESRMLRPWFLLFDFLWSFTEEGKEMEKVNNYTHHTVFRSLLEQHRASAVKAEEAVTPKTSKNFMELLTHLQNANPELNLTDMELLYELTSIYIAGHDATGKSICFTLLFLALNQDWQEKSFDEIFSIFGEDKERPVTIEDLKRMPILESCIKESLRLMPPVPMITRRVGSDVVLDNSRVIPKGTEVAISSYIIHRDPEIYEDPETFNPSRFLEENHIDAYSWIPFSAGPRNCLGSKFALMELKVVLCNLLRYYKAKTDTRFEDLKLKTSITLGVEGGWNVKLFTRKSENNEEEYEFCGRQFA